MTLELIYNACLRAERRLDLELNTADSQGADNYTVAHAVARAVQTIREEIGRDLAAAHNARIGGGERGTLAPGDAR